MNSFLENILTAVSSPAGDVSSQALLQLAMLLEKSNRPSDEEGFYESILPPEALAVELTEEEQEQILSEIAKGQHSPDVSASFLWAIGKSSPKAGLRVLLGLINNQSDIFINKTVQYQALIALESCLGHDEIETLDKPVIDDLRGFVNTVGMSSDEKLAEHSSRLLKRLKSPKPRRTS